MGLLERFFRRLAETDEERLAKEIRTWAEAVPRAVRIAEAPTREPVKIAGIVRRMTYMPVSGHESLEVLLADGTGEMRVRWMGRRSIPGLSLGTKVVVEGVIGEERGARRMVNPRFEFGT
ncbi:MAG TPA: OB-fold nucleic acid binding domain-containing protein [Actinomycetota bacterium]|nr:OB-fold nucleic acid binding domain-containing protein [Actinomycetota bacterium]